MFRSSLGTVIAELVAQNLAACVPGLSVRSLSLPMMLYTISFTLLCLAAALGGHWADPRLSAIPVSDGQGQVVDSDVARGGDYVVVLVVVMRLAGPLLKTIVSRLVQVEYEQPDWEALNFAFFVIGTAANFVGIAVATAILGLD